MKSRRWARQSSEHERESQVAVTWFTDPRPGGWRVEGRNSSVSFTTSSPTRQDWTRRARSHVWFTSGAEPWMDLDEARAGESDRRRFPGTS